MFKIFRLLLFILIIVVLPFVLLLRISIYMHMEYHFHAYICTLIGVIITAFLLFLYFSVFHAGLTGQFGSLTGLKLRYLIAIAIVFGYVFHGLMFLSSTHVKNQDLKSEFRSLHPIMRLGISTLTLIDRKLILTDAERKPEDYRKMGLKTLKNSLHYPQKDGFVYAVDLRTKGRSAFQNTIVCLYFKAMGFKIMRHDGTGDHFHISLYNHDKPYAW